MVHAFLSFVEEDLNVVNLFRGQAKSEHSDLEFADYSINMEKQDPSGTDTKKPNRIEIQLPSAHWTEACQRVGYLGDNPVRPRQLLAAVILDSESWKQSGTVTTEFSAGWSEYSLISSVDLSAELTHTKAISLGKQEKLIAWIVAAATVVIAVAALLALE